MDILSANALGWQQHMPREKGKQYWHAVSRRNPCPICGNADNCKASNDGSAVWCGRIEQGSIKSNAGGQHLHRLGEDRKQLPFYVHPSHKKAAKPAKDWQAEISKLSADEAKLIELADLLNVDATALNRLGVRHGLINGRLGWSFPERDATGKIIGLNHRGTDGSKKQAIGGQRGLTYADDWHAPPGDLYLVEGGSDTAAMMSMGLAVIGRPSNVGGVDLLAELLTPHADRRIVVVAENDKKADGRWPGRAGAITTATQLSERLGRPVCWCLPPEPHKDVRAMLTELGKATRDAFLAEIRLETIAPPTKAELVQYVEPTARVRTLDDWRKEMLDNRLRSLDTVGVYFDGSPTGAGKSYADAQVIARVSSSLTVVPTHVIAGELQQGLVEQHDLVNVEVYPQLTEFTCKNIDEAKRVLAAGLKVGAALCHDCPFQNGCIYREGLDRAKKAKHAIATHERFSLQPDLAAGKTFVSIHEDARGLLRPSRQCFAEDVQAVADIAQEAKHLLSKPEEADERAWQYFNELSAAAEKLIKTIDQAEATSAVKLMPRVNDTPFVERTAWRVMKRLGKTACGDALKIINAFVRGELQSLTVNVDRIKVKDGAEKIIKSLIAVWQTELPTNSVVWVADATGNVETLERLANRKIIDRTPEGRLERRTSVEQIPLDITNGMSPRAVAAHLRGLLHDYPAAQRVGIIGHKKHVDAMLRKRSPLLDEEHRSRICKQAHFREGPDRASNDWQAECEVIVILGTPRIPPNAVAHELVRRGEIEAARQDGVWRAYRWEGKTAAGELRVVEASGYADQAWQAAHRDLVQAALLQAVGRGRGVTDSGVPVVVLSNEPLALPLAERQTVTRVTEQTLAAAQAMRELSDDGQPITTAAVAERLGVSERHARRLIGAAEAVNQSDINAKSIYLEKMSVCSTPVDPIEAEERLAIQAESETASQEADTGPPVVVFGLPVAFPWSMPTGLLGVGGLGVGHHEPFLSADAKPNSVAWNLPRDSELFLAGLPPDNPVMLSASNW